jgi:hypothetical protein
MSRKHQHQPAVATASPVITKIETATLSHRFYGDPFLWAILVLAAGLLFCSLGDRCLWQDEAETALLAQAILRTGWPVASDGANVVSQYKGLDYDRDFVWRWSPWVQFYLAAGSMRLFGSTTLAARLPFAVLGLLAVALTYLLARRLFPPVAVARLSALLLALSVPFLLHVRQARWYAVAFVLAPLCLLGLERMMARQRWGVATFVVAATLLFYTNYFVALGLLAAVALTATLCRPQRGFIGRLSLALLLCLLLALPGVWYFQILGKPHDFQGQRVWTHFQLYGTSFATYLVPLPVLMVLLFLLANGRLQGQLGVEGNRRVWLLLGVCTAYLFYLCLGPWEFFRYLAVLLPIAAILTAVTTFWLFTQSRRVGLLVLLLLIATDVVHGLPLAYLHAPGTSTADDFPVLGYVRFPLFGYLYEISHHVEDPEWVVAEYLRTHAEPQDVVIAGYGDLPLQFYTGLRVVGGLQGQPLPADANWVFVRPIYLSSATDLAMSRFIQKQIVEGNRYQVVRLPGHDMWPGNDPDPQRHVFRMPNHKEAPPLRLLHRKNE